MVSCAQQYLECPEETFRKIASISEFVILLKLLVLDSAEHIITKQTFYEGLHQVPDSSWPRWVFPCRLFDLIAETGDTSYQWKTPTESYVFEGGSIVLEGVLIKNHGNIVPIAEGISV